MVTLQLILIFTLTLTCPKTFARGHVSVFDKYLYLFHVSVNVYTHTHTHTHTLQQDKCKCKKIGCVNVNDLHLH